MDKLTKARLISQYENGLNRVRDKLEQCDPNTMSTEEITIALESLPEMINKLKEFWDKNLKENDL